MRHKKTQMREAVTDMPDHNPIETEQDVTAEQKLWKQLRVRQLNGIRFRRQQYIGQFVADFYSPEANLVITVDSSENETLTIHAENPDILFTELGMRVLHISSKEIFDDVERIVNEIDAFVKDGRSSRVNH